MFKSITLFLLLAASSVIAKLDLNSLLSGKTPLDVTKMDYLYNHFVTEYRNSDLEAYLISKD